MSVPPRHYDAEFAYNDNDRRRNHERRLKLWAEPRRELERFVISRRPTEQERRVAKYDLGNEKIRDGTIEAIVMNAAKRGSLEFGKMEAELRSLAQSFGAPEGFDPLVPPLPYLAGQLKDAIRIGKIHAFPNVCADARDFAPQNPLWLCFQRKHLEAIMDPQRLSLYHSHTTLTKLRREVRRHPLSFDAAGMPMPRRPDNVKLAMVGVGNDGTRDFAARGMTPEEALDHYQAANIKSSREGKWTGAYTGCEAPDPRNVLMWNPSWVPPGEDPFNPWPPGLPVS